MPAEPLDANALPVKTLRKGPILDIDNGRIG